MRISSPGPEAHYVAGLPRVTAVDVCSPEFDMPTQQTLIVPDMTSRVTYSDGICQISGWTATKPKEMVTLVEVHDSLDIDFDETPLLVPRVVADKIAFRYPHLVAQAIVVTPMNSKLRMLLATLDSHYGRHPHDIPWISSAPIYDFPDGDLCFVMNRRVGGWDGTPERPVVELLGAGGHVKSDYDVTTGRFELVGVRSTIQSEFAEELGLQLEDSRISLVGGFTNSVTRELVALSVVVLTWEEVRACLFFALGNVEENIDGLYFGDFEDTMSLYSSNPHLFAGGQSAQATNFPAQVALMERLRSLLRN